MSNNRVRVDAVSDSLQTIALEAKTDLINRLNVDPEIVAVTKLERVERLDIEEERSTGQARGEDCLPDYRIFLLVKGTQYLYETRKGRSPTLVEEKFVL